jgi:SNW domain-containing protein 1
MNRDVSEKIALGMHRGSGQLSGEAMYDSRLFNQSSGMDAGFGAEDEYNTYSKPLFDRQEAGSIYRPKANDSDIYGDADVQVNIFSSYFKRSLFIYSNYSDVETIRYIEVQT